MSGHGLYIQTTLNGDEIAATCNLIVTATPPMIRCCGRSDQGGNAITAMGSDTREKNELEPAILGKADLVVADSIEQCRVRGEIFHALEARALADGSRGARQRHRRPGPSTDLMNDKSPSRT